MNRFKKESRKQNIGLDSILQRYMKDSFQSYTLMVRGSEIQLFDFSYKELKSTYKTSGQSKGQMNLFSNIASKIKYTNPRKNKSPLRSRQHKNKQNSIFSGFKTKQIIGIQKVESKVRQRCKTTNDFAKEPNFSMNKENQRMIDENRTVSDIVPKCVVEVSFQNLQQTFSCVQKMPSQIKQMKEQENQQIPKITVNPPVPKSHQDLKPITIIEQPLKLSSIKPQEEF